MAETLMLPLVNVQGAQIQLFSAGQSIPVAKAIPQLEQVMEAVCAMELRPKSLKLLAYRPGYSCLTTGQLENMHIVQEANKQFILVKKTIAWVKTVEWTVKDLCSPFDDTNAVTKSEYKGYIETLNLGVNKFENEEVEGYKLLDFRENLWLHSTSIMMALLTMRDQYSRVGIVYPRYHDSAAMTQKRTVAKRLGAADPKYERVLGIFNVGSNWVAFMIAKNTKICHTFDPLQSERNYASIERSVRKVMEPVLDLEGKLDYKKIDWCEQQNGSSCGIWCIAVLEMLLAGASWNDKIYRLRPYLRMRYLYEVISLLTKPATCE
uniref:Ubiquitin-like protease family profile domain-containing protein n=1 Tax=Phytophthora ramorum TaxID=164328 RepID=H3H661_PHYRM